MLPGFRRQGAIAAVPAGQLDAGQFYRSLVEAGFSEPAARAASAGAQHTSFDPQQLLPAPPADTATLQHPAADGGTAQTLTQAQPPDNCEAAVHASDGSNAMNSAAGNLWSVHGGVPESAAAEATAGLGSTDRVLISQPWTTEHRKKSGHAVNATGFVGPTAEYAIPRNNIGFRLLEKAGWVHGTGLGAEGQGRQMPLEQSQQKGRRGLGAEEAAAMAAAVKVQQQAQQKQRRKAQEKAPRIPLPEDAESFDTKVKRHRQVMQADADAKAGKAIERYMRMAFNDATGEVTRDNNPLMRRNRLTSSNPLL